MAVINDNMERKTYKIDGKIITRQRRISLIFKNVILRCVFLPMLTNTKTLREKQKFKNNFLSSYE